jgi:hypothetical protein
MSMGGMSDILPLIVRRNAAPEAPFLEHSLPFVKAPRVTLEGSVP